MRRPFVVRGLEVLCAGAAAGVSPVLLEHVVVAAKRLVVFSSGRCTCGSAQTVRIAGGGSSEVEVALVAIFLAAGVKPGVQVRIGDGFFQFVRNNVRHAVNAALSGGSAVGAGALYFAAGGAAV